MTAFPDIYMVASRGYQVDPDDGTELLRASSGKLRAQRLYDETRYNIRFLLVGLTAANTQALRQFYETYKLETLEWTDPYTGVIYDVIMTRPPRVVGVETPWATAQIEMEGTRQ